MRADGRTPDALRPVTLHADFISQALGSVLVQAGRTRVICTANVQRGVPPWLEHRGWVTAEYAMLPGATAPRGSRNPGGRGKEIQRLIGRSLRAAVDLHKLVGSDGPLSVFCDCDVIEADGGTRTASITGAFVALRLAVRRLLADGRLAADPMRDALAAVSVGMVAPEPGADAVPMLDLCYEEDSQADVDLNVVRLGEAYVEIQGTAEAGAFSRQQLTGMLDLADGGIAQLMQMQRQCLEGHS